MNNSVNRSMRNYDALRKWNQRLLKRMNDIYLEAELVVGALRDLKAGLPASDTAAAERIKLSVPSVKGKDLKVFRKAPDLHRMIDNRIDSREFIQSLVFAVALTEEYLSDVLELIIRAYPQKLFISPKGNALKDDQMVPVDVREILKARSLAEIIQEQVSKRVRDAIYATPKQYSTYLASVVGFALPEDLLRRFFEVKATRDVHIHNGGLANSIYIQKAGGLARAMDGVVLPVDGEYLKGAISCQKKIFTQTYKGMLEKYGDSEKVQDILNYNRLT